VKATILLAHGSRDPEWRRPIEAACARLGELAPDRRACAAYLEHGTPSLAQAVAALVAAGVDDIVVVPAFLSGGGHVKLDVPRLVAEAAAAHPGLRIRAAADALGETAEVIEALARAALRLAGG
jgi:sirohydrochlorin cobaltochelatase